MNNMYYVKIKFNKPIEGRRSTYFATPSFSLCDCNNYHFSKSDAERAVSRLTEIYQGKATVTIHKFR